QRNDEPANPSRRRLFQVVGAAGAFAALPAHSAGVQPSALNTTYVFLNPAEARFIEAAVTRLIPSDEPGPEAIRHAQERSRTDVKRGIICDGDRSGIAAYRTAHTVRRPLVRHQAAALRSGLDC